MRISFIYLLFSMVIAKTAGDLAHLPGGCLSEIWYLITNGSLEHFYGCKDVNYFSENDVSYFLHTRKNPDPVPLTLNNLSILDVEKDTKILFNGWGGRTTDDSIVELVTAYLTRYDCNVIAVEYINLTAALYTEAYCNIIEGSEIIGNFLCKLFAATNLNFSKLHIVGHSLGAQISGLIGQEVQQVCGQTIGRITGLDPAGPIYQNQNLSQVLDSTDAEFVDIIHTNMGFYGYYGAMGHADYYPNCGVSQPGCVNWSIDIVEMIHNFIGCSHGRSVELFIESVYNETGRVFKSTSCDACPTRRGFGKCELADKKFPYYSIMGEDSRRNKSNSGAKFVLNTNRRYPFARGK